MRGQIDLRAWPVRSCEQDLPARDAVQAKLEARRLLAIKALLLLACACAVLSARLISPALGKRVGSAAGGFDLRYPGAWKTDWRTPWGAGISEEEVRFGQPCKAFFLRLDWRDFEMLYGSRFGRPPGAGWRDDEAGMLTAVAAWFGGDDARRQTEAERLQLGARPAVVIVSRRGQEWSVVAVAPGEDLALLGVQAPTSGDLDRVWKQWKAMVAAVRLAEPEHARAGDIEATGP